MEEEKVKLRCEAYYFGAEIPEIKWDVRTEETGEILSLTSK